MYGWLFRALCVIWLVREANSANWAQVSGPIKQNVVLTQHPSPDSVNYGLHWGARFGMAVTHYESGANLDVGEVYLMGGDTYDKNFERKGSGLLDKRVSHGYKNDVWKTEGTDWTTMGDVKETNGVKVYIRYPSMKYKRQRMPRTKSKLLWKRRTGGISPRPGQTYEDFILCHLPRSLRDQAAFDAKDCCEEGEQSLECNADQAQWSPRRHHAALSLGLTEYSRDATCSTNNYIFLMGGRAREFVDLKPLEHMGGVIGAVVKDIYTSNKAMGLGGSDILERTQREATVLKNDVWRTQDGQNWELVTPGCRMNEARYVVNGLEEFQCSAVGGGCYGAEQCVDTTADTVCSASSARCKCVCNMWSPREQHTVGAFRDQMYVVGGYASKLYRLSRCGEFDCGDSTDGSTYRHYLDDLWQSANGQDWHEVAIPDQFRYSGRGGHAMLLYPDNSDGRNYIWLFGGRGGDSDGTALEQTYYADIWRFEIDTPKVIVAGRRLAGGGLVQSILTDRRNVEYSYSFQEGGSEGDDGDDGDDDTDDPEDSVLVTGIAFSPDPNDMLDIPNQYMVTVDALVRSNADDDSNLNIGRAISWNLEGDKLDRAISGDGYFYVEHTAMYSVCFAFYPNTDPLAAGPKPVIVTGHGDGKARVWTTNSNLGMMAGLPVPQTDGDEVQRLSHGSQRITAVAASTCHPFIVTGSVDKSVKIWQLGLSNTEPQQVSIGLLQTIPLGAAVTALAFSPDEEELPQLAMAFGPSARIYLYVNSVFNLIHTLLGHTGNINAIAYSPPGLTFDGAKVMLVTCSTDKTARVWDADRGTSLRVIQGHNKPMTSVSFSPQESPITVVVGMYDGQLLTYDIQQCTNAANCRNTATELPDGGRASADVVAYKPSSGFLEQANRWVDTTANGSSVEWTPRAGHTVTMEDKTRQLVLVGGETAPLPGATERVFSEEVWTMRPDEPNEFWRLDYSEDAYFKTGTGEGLHWDLDSPTLHYVAPESDLAQLKRFVLPDKVSRVPSSGKRAEVKYPILDDHRIRQLNDLGIYSIQELANADKYKVLKLRGYDVPQVPEEGRMDFYNICDILYLAKAIVDMCTVTTRGFYAGEMQMPWNVENEFAGVAPTKGEVDDDITPAGLPQEWHGRDFADYFPMVEYDVLVKSWDGCSELALPPLAKPTAFNNYPNVNGLGWVRPADKISDPLKTLQELQCKWNPGSRAYHSSILYEDRTYIFGGKSSEHSFNADTWYRDDKMPTATFKSRPSDYDNVGPDSHIFYFNADEVGSSFEYRIWFQEDYQELLPWTPVTYKADVSWLDWRAGGPGDNLYTFFVRAVDPAGNRDELYIVGSNLVEWYYVSPTAWDLIMEGIGGFLALTLFGYLEYRRRKKKAAMERYAMKRMRRKFKAMQRDEEGGIVDWRTLYNENKTQDAAKRKSKKQEREEKKRAREKEKKKRDKEKENIKKKLKAGKDHKDKQRKAIEKQEEKKALKAEKKPKKGKKDKGQIEDGGGGPDTKKLKDYEKEGGGPDTKKLKDYEKDPNAPSGDPAAEQGTKQRKSNKRYKDYEVEEGGGKKDK